MILSNQASATIVGKTAQLVIKRANIGSWEMEASTGKVTKPPRITDIAIYASIFEMVFFNLSIAPK